jgi:hypothetical protein
MEATIPGVSSGNARDRKIRKFLEKPPPRAVRLVLLAPDPESGDVVPLAEWAVEAVHPALEPDISQQLEDMVSDDGAPSEVHASLVYVDESSTPVTVCKLPVRRRDSLANKAINGVERFSGTPSSLVQQAQTQQERMHRLEMTSIITVLQQSERLINRSDQLTEKAFELVERMADRLGLAEEKVTDRDMELDAMAAQVRAAHAGAVAAAPAGAGANAKILERIITPEFLAAVVTRLLGSGEAPRPLPRSPPAEPEPDPSHEG